MTPREINGMKRDHNELQEHGRKLYKELEKLFQQCIDLQDAIRQEEGDDYDGIPLLFGGGYHLDPDL